MCNRTFESFRLWQLKLALFIEHNYCKQRLGIEKVEKKIAEKIEEKKSLKNMKLFK